MNSLSRQNGVALLVAMMALLTSTALYIASEHQSNTRNNKDNVLPSLLAAKQALMAYAVNYADNYGHNTRGGVGRLPCPAIARFSTPARSCRPDAIGYLPSVWERDGRQIEIDYLERFLDRDIWYAISADHRYNPSFNTLNSYRGQGLLSVDSLQDIVAVLIAPGAESEAQTRTGSDSQYSAIADYLEGENADADSEFTVTEENDLLVPIRRAEILPLMERRVLGFVKQWLIEYKSVHGFYPYASPLAGNGACEQSLLRGMLASEAGSCAEHPFADMLFSDLPSGRALRQTWFHRYRWPSLIYYLVDESCSPANGLVDCDGVDDPERLLRVDGEQVEVILISVGEPIENDIAGGLQVRDDIALANYLDTDVLLLADTEFTVPLLADHSNDQLVFID